MDAASRIRLLLQAEVAAADPPHLARRGGEGVGIEALGDEAEHHVGHRLRGGRGRLHPGDDGQKERGNDPETHVPCPLSVRAV